MKKDPPGQLGSLYPCSSLNLEFCQSFDFDITMYYLQIQGNLSIKNHNPKLKKKKKRKKNVFCTTWGLRQKYMSLLVLQGRSKLLLQPQSFPTLNETISASHN